MKRLFLVDDYYLFRQFLALILEQETGLTENIQAGTLAEAHRILDDLDREVDLAVVDLDLPEADTTELIEDLREIDVPVLAFTSCSSHEPQASALRAGAGEVLTTATSSEKILDAAKRLIRR